MNLRATTKHGRCCSIDRAHDTEPVRLRRVSADDHVTGLVTECNAAVTSLFPASALTLWTPRAGRGGKVLALRGNGQSLDAAIALAVVLVVFRRAILRAVLGVLAFVTLAALGAGVVVLYQIMHG